MVSVDYYCFCDFVTENIKILRQSGSGARAQQICAPQKIHQTNGRHQLVHLLEQALSPQQWLETDGCNCTSERRLTSRLQRESLTAFVNTPLSLTIGPNSSTICSYPLGVRA